MRQRNLSTVDHLIEAADGILRTLTPEASAAERASPAQNTPEPDLSPEQRRHIAGLMRINHTGEVCAQALYQGQALTAELPEVREQMEQAAREEIDHLVWCEERLRQLGGRTSLLNPVFYGMSFALGAAAGLVSDKVSLGFVAATEERVADHLRDHLDQLPEEDQRSRAIIEQMLQDEEHHGDQALAAGGKEFPQPVKALMSRVARLMTESTYRI